MNVSCKHLRSALVLSLAGAAAFAVTGCASRRYYYAAAPPSPPSAYSQRPPLIDLADHNGFLAGSRNGSRDFYSGHSYRPEHSREFHDTPGYEPNLGPFEPYRQAFRDAYLRGYSSGFRQQ